jgi:hypothetical protein
MMKTIRHLVYALPLAAIVFLSAISVAQVPSQFTGLLTTTTDYTCAGVVPCSTWPMPAMPAAGSSYVDPTWGTTTYRLAVPSANTSRQAITTYNRVQAWNSNDTRMFLTETPGQAFIDLYDATTTPPTPINRITTTDGTYVDSFNADALWAFTDPNRIYYVPWASAEHGRELRYVDVSKCTKSNCELRPVTVHAFSCKTDAYSRLGAGVPGNVIETGSGGQGGMFDSTDRYFSFTCDNVNGGGRTEIDFIRYDRQLDKVTTQEKWYTICPGNVPTGCRVFNECPAGGGKCDTNIIRMNQHPNANYITVAWQCSSLDSRWARGCGTEVFGPDYTFLGPASASIQHQDNGFDISGVPVWVGVGTNRLIVSDERAIEITNLTTLSTKGITSKRVLLPCNYNRTGPGCDSGTFLGAKLEASHISMTGSWGSFPGYALFSTMTLAGTYYAFPVEAPAATALGTEITSPGTHTISPASMRNIGVGVVSVIDFKTAKSESVKWTTVDATTATATFTKTHLAAASVSCVSCGDTGFGAMENLAVKIDTTAADSSNAVFYRIGRAMSIRDADYNAEPHTAVDRNFTQIIWGSNWNVDGGRNYSFWTKLPISPPVLNTTSLSPNFTGVSK